MAAPVENKSYLAGTLNAFSPWGSRDQTPKPVQERFREQHTGSTESRAQQGGDHTISNTHRLSLKRYPKDCPRLRVQWFHAVDVPKRKPNYVQQAPPDDQTPVIPKKWIAFSAKDSRSLEAAFHKYSDEEEQRERQSANSDDVSQNLGLENESSSHHKPSRSMGSISRPTHQSPKLPVNEDYLFDVDIGRRELAPAYWTGPIYEVRRGTWFLMDGSTLKPCDETLSTQLEEGYVKTKPWRQPDIKQRSTGTVSEPSRVVGLSADTPVDLTDDQSTKVSDATKDPAIAQQQLFSHRLFGSQMNNVAIYPDSNSAYVLSDDFWSRMTGSVYQRFAGGAHLSGTKYIRGFSEMAKKKATKDDTPSKVQTATSTVTGPTTSALGSDLGRRRSQSVDGALESGARDQSAQVDIDMLDVEDEPETKVQTLERQLSSLVSATEPENPEKQDEEARKRDQNEIENDYRDEAGDMQDRGIDHLILVTHGIGQRLGARFETFNFIHDVNELRKTLKTVYGASPDLQALNSEIDELPKNCRVQVLPICWRHLLDFPQQGVRQNRKEHDIADAQDEDDEYPDLAAITVEGVPALRNIVADLALDILLYQTPAYKDHISRIVVKECNRIFKLFKKRNPSFNGQISLVGHSLGSAIMFDVLADQQRDPPAFERATKHRQPEDPDLKFRFDVDHFFCVGSPIGLFQMLKGLTIAGRSNPNKVTLDGYSDSLDEPYQDGDLGGNSLFSPQSSKLPSDLLTDSQKDAMVSSPKCRQLFNIFHPSDPIAYRLEPLISPAMKVLKPQALPYTKRNFFGAPMGQGITGIPARVGQSFSGFWSNLSSGLASSFINKSLGISAEDAAKLRTPGPSGPSPVRSRQSVGAGTNITAGGVLGPDGTNLQAVEVADAGKQRQLAKETANAHEEGAHPPTLIDGEIETLYSGFHKNKLEQQSETDSTDAAKNTAWASAEERGRKLRREEAKVRALNSNGRVDYSIQEGAFDISFLASIASHLAYWTDEDVSHFIMSQLLSRQQTTLRKAKSTGSLR